MTKEEVLENKEMENLLTYMAENNSSEFNFNKAIEEATEFMEAAVKLRTKSAKNPKRPTREDVLEEYTDFSIRGLVYVKTLFPKLSLEEVIEMSAAYAEKKANALFGWLKSGEYANGL